ncbi:ATP-dependent RNA helicase HrpA [Thorsellia anophelis]|uniref:RNA helicase n=1 Tax=Thorsellia anophelis DSM 18579 TaxID=1123402 RepID=A0A1I0CMR4_9GAMM|nr:ATP-dependent RNA helicase HrpA [Thorsellia anophelis]SET20976.1 ATP-dependent helicase HrpA [Thorsellia anophelis DSM 18579]
MTSLQQNEPQCAPLTLKVLYSELDQLLIADAIKLKRRIRGIDKIRKDSAKQAVMKEILQEIENLKSKVTIRKQSVPIITYPETLPVSQKREDILKAIAENQVVVIAGETGSGKTTQIPKMCLELGRGIKGFIGHTQPRRLAARAVAQRLADELTEGEQVGQIGQTVGFKVRFSDHVSDKTLVKLMTDGILLAEIQQDKLLSQYDTIIIDEAHERSLNIDFILGYLASILPKRPDLKVIITSATIDPERFAKHFSGKNGPAPIIEVSGRTYPVEVRYRPIYESNTDEEIALEAQNENEKDLIQAIIEAADELSYESDGDILVFLTGEREIRDVAEALGKETLNNPRYRHTEVVPLYARLSNSEQNRIFQPHTGRRIVLATNVAETSLTVPGIKYVIDSGTARISRYSYRTKVQRLPIEPISQASANQRKGRCGRVSEGICIRLYSEADFLGRPEFTTPEILRTNLASVILQMLSIGLGDIEAFPFIEPPDIKQIQDGLRLLEELGALTSQKGLTQLGRQLAQLPLDPKFARMIIAASQTGAVQELLIITAALSIQDPRERPQDRQQASDEMHRRFIDERSDFMAFINLWRYVQEQDKALTNNQFRRMCKKEFLNYLRLREWEDVYTQLRQTIKLMGLPINSEPADFNTVHMALLCGLITNVGMKEAEKHEYQGTRNTRFHIFPNSAVFKKPPKWILVAELMETTRLWGRVCAQIDPLWIEPLATHLVKHTYSEPHWSKKQGAVMAYEKVTLFGLPIVAARLVNYAKIDPEICRELFIRHALIEGEWTTKHAFYHENRKLLAEVEALEHRARRRDILVDNETLYEFYDERIDADAISAKHFDTWWKNKSKDNPDLLNFEKQMLIREDAQKVSQSDFPVFWHQGSHKFKLTYQFEPGEFDDGVTVHIPLGILNQVQDIGFDWSVPGLRHTLVMALIKSLPKSLRRNFVPAPNFAEAVLARVTDYNVPMLSSIEKELRKMTGVTIDEDDWDLEGIESHLKMTFKVFDEHNKVVAKSKNLTELKATLQPQVEAALAAVGNQIESDIYTDWSFDSIPMCQEQRKKGYTLKAYPALVDNKESVVIKYFDSVAQQQLSMREGLRRLVLLNIPSPIKYLHEHLPNKAKLGLYFNPYGKVMTLIDDCIKAAIDHLISAYGGVVWEKNDYEKLIEYIKANINETVVAIANRVEQILSKQYELSKQLKGKIDMNSAFALSDIKQQLSRLVFPEFVVAHGSDKLPDILRYLNGIEKRLEKLKVDALKDRAQMLKVQAVEQQWQNWFNKLTLELKANSEVITIRWMIEELRISLFAQQLGTPYPISEKRILQAMMQIET